MAAALLAASRRSYSSLAAIISALIAASLRSASWRANSATLAFSSARRRSAFLRLIYKTPLRP